MQTTNKVIVLFGMATCLLIHSIVTAGESIKLRYQFQKDQQMAYSVDIDQDITHQTDLAPSIKQKVSTRMKAQMIQRVKEVQGGVASIEIGFPKFWAKNIIGENEFPIPGLDSISKMRLTVRMTKRGQLSDPKIDNRDAMDQQVLEVAENMRKSISQNLLIFPEKAVAISESWKAEEEIPIGLPGAENLKAKMVSVFKLTAIKEVREMRCAQIHTDIKLSVQGKITQDGIPIEANMEGSGKGENLFAVSEGRLVQTNGSFTLTGRIKAYAQGQLIETQTQMDLNIKMELK
jgi:hypothetical protein